jgi:hypothetical protein
MQKTVDNLGETYSHGVLSEFYGIPIHRNLWSNLIVLPDYSDTFRITKLYSTCMKEIEYLPSPPVSFPLRQLKELHWLEKTQI